MKRTRTFLICAGLAVIYALPLFTLPGFSAAYLKIANITGESAGEDQPDGTGGTSTVHKDEIDVLAWSWGESSPGAANTGGAAQGGRECIQDVSITKWIDKSSPDLMLHCFDGKHIPEATLTLTESSGGGSNYDYFIVRMVDVVVTSVANAGEAAAPDRPVESFSFNFAKIEFKYVPQDAGGSPDPGNAVEIKWDLEANKQY